MRSSDVVVGWFLIAGSRVLLRTTTTWEFVEFVDSLCHAFDGIPQRPVDAQRVERATTIASKFSPGSHCLHRAATAKFWLAFYGVDSKIVIGFRKRKEFEGHAWLEIPGDQTATMFSSDDDGFRTTWIP